MFLFWGPAVQEFTGAVLQAPSAPGSSGSLDYSLWLWPPAIGADLREQGEDSLCKIILWNELIISATPANLILLLKLLNFAY